MAAAVSLTSNFSRAAFAFDGVVPHVVSRRLWVESLFCFVVIVSRCQAEETKKARGPYVGVSRAGAHLYVYCSKVGSLRSFTNFWHFIDYEV